MDVIFQGELRLAWWTWAQKRNRAITCIHSFTGVLVSMVSLEYLIMLPVRDSPLMRTKCSD
jgi:hypothetical protein